jgi:RHS repeat-associated protein
MRYHYDPDGAVDSREELVEGRREVFHMDGHDRLKAWELEYGLGGSNPGHRTSTYTYDDFDNLREVSVTGSAISPYTELFTNGNGGRPHALYNQSQPDAPQTFHYDGRGRLTSGEGRQYTYTSFDLPRTITSSSGTTTFAYDAFGKRVKKWGPSGTTISLGDLYESREEVSGMRHVFVVPGSDGPIAQIIYRPAQKERSVHYLHQDALGSVSVTTAQGAPVSRSHYEPFGARVDVGGNPVAGLTPDIRNGFTGHVHDDDLGLIHMRGRVYDPGTRRFLTPDPLARLDDNPYSYVRHDPLNWIDPSGFEPEAPGRRYGAGASGFEFGFGADGFSGSAAYGGGASGSDVVEQVIVSMANAAAQFPRGNDAPNSSGCPQGTGTAPRPCAGAGNAGCPPGAAQMDRIQRVSGSGEEGVGAFLEGAFLGGFSGSGSWSTVAGSTAVGFIPVVGQIADIRDLAAAVMHVAEGEEGAWLELGASTLGVVPGLDFAKGMAKGATRAGKEALEEVVTRGAVDLADNVPVPGHALAAAGGGSIVRIGDGSAIRTFRGSGSGTDLSRSTVIGGQKYQVKSGHGFLRPHASGDLRSAGLSMDAIETAILDDLTAFQTSGGVIPRLGHGFSGPMQRNISLGGYNIAYRAADVGAQISVGTYFLVP